MKKVLIVSFADHRDQQDIAISIYESVRETYDAYIMLINTHKSYIEPDKNVRFVKCPLKPGIGKGTFNIKNLHSVISWIKRNRFDFILFESLHVWNVIIMLLIRAPFYYQMIFDVIPHEGEKTSRAVVVMNRLISKLADRVLLTNKKYMATMSELYKTPKEKVVYVPIIRRFPEFIEPRYTKKMLFFGRINPYKGASNLYEIAKRMSNISFEVYGTVYPQEEEIVKKLRSLKNVSVHTGYIIGEKVKQAFIDCDWVILPYNSATTSGVIIDAYLHSRPVVAFNVGAISEQVSDGESGFLIEEKNINKFCQRLNEVVNYPEEKVKQFCNNAYNYGMSLYSSQKVGFTYKQIFAESIKMLNDEKHV